MHVRGFYILTYAAAVSRFPYSTSATTVAAGKQ
jgi:hypothetical protein